MSASDKNISVKCLTVQTCTYNVLALFTKQEAAQKVVILENISPCLGT